MVYNSGPAKLSLAVYQPQRETVDFMQVRGSFFLSRWQKHAEQSVHYLDRFYRIYEFGSLTGDPSDYYSGIYLQRSAIGNLASYCFEHLLERRGLERCRKIRAKKPLLEVKPDILFVYMRQNTVHFFDGNVGRLERNFSMTKKHLEDYTWIYALPTKKRGSGIYLHNYFIQEYTKKVKRKA